MWHPVIDELEPQLGAEFGVACGIGPNAFVLVAPPRENRLALGILFKQPGHVGFDDRQAANESRLRQSRAKCYCRGEADEMDRP